MQHTITAVQATQQQVEAICKWVMDLGNVTIWDCHGIIVQYYDGFAFIIN